MLYFYTKRQEKEQSFEVRVSLGATSLSPGIEVKSALTSSSQNLTFMTGILVGTFVCFGDNSESIT